MVSRIPLILAFLCGACTATVVETEPTEEYGVTRPAPAGDGGPAATSDLPGQCFVLAPSLRPTWVVCALPGNVDKGDPAPLPGDPEKR